MSFDLDDLLNDLENDSVFEELPVDPATFVMSEEYLNLKVTLSDYQLGIIMAGSQIYDKETLFEYLTPSEAEKRWEQTYNEIIMVLGKGSGKDFISSVTCLYIVYLFLCLKDPQDYYEKPPGDYIDIVNIAQNSTQANQVFFSGLKERLKRSKWFQNRYFERANEIVFPEKNIRLISGHSKAESLEGYNVAVCVLDEISGFDDESGTGKKVTADSIYDMWRASVTSRFGQRGKLLLLSFPRHTDCFISRRYRTVIAEKEVVERHHEYIIKPEIPPVEGNTFSITWEEDHIKEYKYEGVYALRRPSWEVNPTKKLEDYKLDFIQNMADALSRFACMPPTAVNATFKDRQAVEDAFTNTNGIDEEGRFYDWFLPDPAKEYFVHVDLSTKHDRCVVVMSHVDKWTQAATHEFSPLNTGVKPEIVVDVVKYWEPKSTEMVDFGEVREFILSLRSRGFNLKKVSFDQYRSEEFIKNLNGVGIRAELLHGHNSHYFEMIEHFASRRIHIPNISLAVNEFLKLRPNNSGKIEAPSGQHDDLAVCITESVWTCVKNARRWEEAEVEVKTYNDVYQQVPNLEAEVDETVIRAPRSAKHASPEVRSLLESMNLI